MASIKTFEKKITDLLDEKNCWHVKFFANRNTRKGISDLLCSVNGRFVAIETKQPGEKKTELQKYNIQKINADGGIAFFAISNQWNEVDALIRYIYVNNTCSLFRLYELFPSIDFQFEESLARFYKKGGEE